MKQSLQLRASQHLALTPQLQQSIRLLQLSTLDLNQELEQILQENPLLERLNDPIDSAIRLRPDGALIDQSTSFSEPAQPSYLSDRSDTPDPDDSDESVKRNAESDDGHGEDSAIWDEARRHHSNQDDDGEDQLPQLDPINPSLREYLLDQANLSTRTERDAALLSLLIESLDDNGYLDESLEQIHANLPAELGVELDDLVFALNFLQSLEPAGVGARNASECLALQIKRLPHIPMVTRRLALTLVQNYLAQFAGHDFTKIKKALDCDDQQLREVQDVIQQCEPHPGRCFSKECTGYIAPDVIVTKSHHGWHVELNKDVIPKLQINALYANLLTQNKQSKNSESGTRSLHTQLQEARWLIRNIHQRYDTILRVSQAIVDRQRNFFAHGAIAMRPLVLREIADTLELHESTISRVTTQKYMLTPHGIVELKYFFGSHIATEAGGEASSTAIRALIKQLIGDENHHKPLSDSKIANILGEQGMVVARRTVAKYREGLKIPAVNLRKIL